MRSVATPMLILRHTLKTPNSVGMQVQYEYCNEERASLSETDPSLASTYSIAAVQVHLDFF